MDTIYMDNTDNPPTNDSNIHDPTVSGPPPVLLLLSILIVFSGIIVGSIMIRKPQTIRDRASGNRIALSLVPSTQTISAGQEFTEAITANTNGQTVSAAELHLSFDATKLQAVKIDAGTFLPVVLTAGAIGNGTTSITLVSQPTAPQKGSGILASVRFKLLTNTPTDVVFADTTQVAAIGRTDNAVGTKTGAHITTATAPTNTLAPAPSGAHTATPTPTKAPTPLVTTPPLGFSQIDTTNSPLPAEYPTYGRPAENAPSTNLIAQIFSALINFLQCTIFRNCPTK